MATKKFHFTAGETFERLQPADLGLKYTSLQRFEIGQPGGPDSVRIESTGEELCLVVVAGRLAYRHQDRAGAAALGDVLYLPIDSRIELSGGPAAVVRFGAPCARMTRFVHVPFSEVDADERHKVYGTPASGTRRDVWNFIDEQFDSSRFLVGICHGAPGGWTAWPPHEHGDKREETYVYFDMGNGFGLQCVYEDMDGAKAVALVRDGDVVAIPQGYHPNVGCPKSGIRYVYCMVSLQAEDRNFMDLRTQRIFGERLE
ncbi:5-deoxy-glucuronate isomerase [Propionivibrio sp.]|uniref:5-deoxy-glucuronate isomerase n=1 Tax=Propionivibrio sp. TaxID=2212460 RepID=UPI0039E4BB74